MSWTEIRQGAIFWTFAVILPMAAGTLERWIG